MNDTIASRLLTDLKRRRWAVDDWLSETGRLHTFSPTRYNLHRHILPLLDHIRRSPCLDAGSGRAPYRRILEERGIRVISVDLDRRGTEVDLIEDIQRLDSLSDGSFQAVLCTQVLEHVPRPWKAAREFGRVLAPGGLLIVSVPHLSILHEAPHDYWRFTRYGLQALFEEHGFEVLALTETGGLLSFAGHGCSLVLWLLASAIPGTRHATWLLNYITSVKLLGWTDRGLGMARLCPSDYVMLARKRHPCG